MAASLQEVYLPRGAAKAPPFTSPQAHSLIFPKSLGVERLYSKLQWPIIQCIYQFPVIWRFTLKKKKKNQAINVVSKIENISEPTAYSSSLGTKPQAFW
ncbi:rCG57282, partial [Rattus norvegicus]